CTAPLLFGLCAAVVALTSPRWQQLDQPKQHPAARLLQRVALWLTAAVYVQIVLGAQLRHLPPESAVGWFKLWVWLKLVVAGLIAA
ncbi:MAG: hypothetical protein GTO03_09505, partial [Planctomycetales bacterium]|nr:hypothetical protein [Planctomycetales bacterium]